jgi:hypothetical protein
LLFNIPVRASSFNKTYFSASNDGNFQVGYNNCSKTNYEMEPYIIYDLIEEKSIQNLIIINGLARLRRNVSDNEGLENMKVRMFSSNSSDKDEWDNENSGIVECENEDGEKFEGYLDKNNSFMFSGSYLCARPLKGRYFIIQLLHDQEASLELCEALAYEY